MFEAEGVRARLEVGRQVDRRQSERASGADEHPATEDVVARAADCRADAERQRLADERCTATSGERPDEAVLEPVHERADRRAGDALGDQLAPIAIARHSLARSLARQLRDEIDSLLAQHHREHERAGTFGIGDRNAVDLGDGLGEQSGGLEESDGFGTAERERHPGADARNDRRRSDGCTAGGHGGEVAPLEDAHDLDGGGIRVAQANAAQVRNDDRPLDGEDAIEHAHEHRMLVRTGRRKPSPPRCVIGEGVDAVHLVGHNGPILCARTERMLGSAHLWLCAAEQNQTKRFARSRSSAKSTSTAYRSEMSSGCSSTASCSIASSRPRSK